MSNLKNYIVDLKSMEKDVCEMDFSVENDLFQGLEQEEIKGGYLDVHLCVKKLAGVFDLSFDINGEVIIVCDRCLDDMAQPISTEAKVRVKFGSEYKDDGSDVIIVPETEGVINVAWLIYEFAALAIPIQHVHPAGECNPEMMDILKLHEGHIPEEMNPKGVEGADADCTESDPRWNKLKNLLNNN